MLNGIMVKKQEISIKLQTIYALCAAALAVVIPQLVHLIGAVSGVGTSLGEMFLPMHLPIMLVGFIAGPYAGAMAGVLGPAASFVFSGMPSSAMLPFIMIELCFYGLTMGLLRNTNMPALAKVFITQIAGRAVRALAIISAVYIFKNTSISISVIWLSITKGIFGLALQWALMPLIAYRIEN